MIKKLTLVILALSFVLLSAPSTVFAKNMEEKKNEFLNDESLWHSIDELDELDISNTYSYEELRMLFIENGFTENEAECFIGEEAPVTRSNTTVRYSLFKLNTFTYNGVYKLQPRITVGLEYYGTSASPSRIVSLKAPHIYTGLGQNCRFAGTMWYELEAGNSFYYNFYGDIYKTGTVSWSVGTEIKIGQKSSITGTISNDDGFIKNVSDAGHYYSAGLDR